MQLITTTRLTGALAMGAFGILAACSPKKEQTTDTLATTPPATATTPAATPSDVATGWTDANVVDVLTVANQGEVDYSQIGVEKATNPSVKQFAQIMVKDHGTMLDAVKSLATKLNVTPARERQGQRSPEGESEGHYRPERQEGRQGLRQGVHGRAGRHAPGNARPLE